MIRREKPIAADCPRAQASIGGYMLVVRSIRGLPTTAATPLPLSTYKEALSLYAYNRATVADVAEWAEPPPLEQD